VPHFAVMLAGDNCINVEIADAGEGTTFRPTGFFTTRFVRALSADEASRAALMLDLRQLTTNGRDADCDLSIRDIREDREGFAKFAPGKGFTWF
jgi:hypothetical protein